MPAAGSHLAHEFLAVGGVAHRRRRQQVERRHLHVVGERDEAVDVGERHLDALRVEPAGCVQAAGQAAQHLLVEYRQRRAAGAFVDDEADRVRADVDDADAARAECPGLPSTIRAPRSLRRPCAPRLAETGRDCSDESADAPLCRSGTEHQTRHRATQPQCAAPARQRRICHEIVMGNERFLARLRPAVGAVRLPWSSSGRRP